MTLTTADDITNRRVDQIEDDDDGQTNGEKENAEEKQCPSEADKQLSFIGICVCV